MPLARKLNHLKISYKYRKLRPYIDSAFYNATYPDVLDQRADPLVHYLLYGWQEGRDPSPWFSTTTYLAMHRDVAAAGVNPLLHYIQHGREEGRALAPPPTSTPRPFTPSKDVDHVKAMRHYIAMHHAPEAARAKPSDIDRLAHDVISDKLAAGDSEPILPTDGSALKLHMAAVHSLFDREYYLDNNAEVHQSGLDPLKHYCTQGWKNLLKPKPDFDPWWYWREHLDPRHETIDPLLHYALAGRNAGLRTKSSGPKIRHKSGTQYDEDQSIKRICLFAGYDPHGIIDEYVIEYLKEISKYSDIYYLSDCRMQASEAAKLNGIVKQAWHIRHGEYDFGSYARLARDLVGWETIARYDELIFANDSCYLVKPLGPVFRKMDALATDWWGLQATKGLLDSRLEERERYPTAIPMEVVKRDYLNVFENDYNYNFFIGSYFTVYRKDILSDAKFQKYINDIAAQESKLQIIRKYEIGLFRFLNENGYHFETFVDDLYPIHPIYSERIFELIDNGFPLFKRLTISENNYLIENLGDWKAWLTHVAPDANVGSIERNILRVCDNERLYQNFHVRKDAASNPVYPQLLSDAEMAELDPSTPKHDSWWAFPVCAYDHSFASNERAVFEAVRHDPMIKKIILTRSRHIALDGENVEIYPLRSPEGQQALLRSKVIFVKHTPINNALYPLSGEHHHFIGLWHGIPLKRIGYASLDAPEDKSTIIREHRKFSAAISSSKVDTMAMSAGFYPLSYNDIWMTGLPRNDFITCPFDGLPNDLQEEERQLRNSLGNRRLILFCPTFRNGQNGNGYLFTDEEKQRLYRWLDENHATLGIREHMADRHQLYSEQLHGDNILDVSSSIYPNIEILFRASSCLITDYSSCFIDYMLTGQHEISFAYDLESYEGSERGTFYDLDFCFPGDICQKFDDVINALERAAARNFRNGDPAHSWKKRLFFEFTDDRNSDRVVRKVKNLLGWGKDD